MTSRSPLAAPPAIRRWLFFAAAGALIATYGCSSTGGDATGSGGGGSGAGSPTGSGGTNAGSGGDVGTGGADVCACSVAPSGCGSRLALAAQAAGCTIPPLGPQLADNHDALLACDSGTWSVDDVCADGCVVGSDGAADACSTVLPQVSMEELVVQAQVEPFRGDQAALPGDDAVEHVQRALVDEGYSASIDGWFGNETADRYTDWQTSLGFTGLAANGVPGPSSLATLGMARFDIVNPILVGAQTTYGGRTVNERTRDMLAEVDALLGYNIVVTQGSYNAGGVSASAGTHDGGGTVDVSVLNRTTSQRWDMIRTMRQVGFAAWLRTPNQGNWPFHIHAVAVGDTDVSNSARNQIADYYVGRNGLSSHAADNTPANYQVPFTWWEAYVRSK